MKFQKRMTLKDAGLRFFGHISETEVLFEDIEDETLCLYRIDEYAHRVVIYDGSEYRFARFAVDDREEKAWRNSKTLPGIPEEETNDPEFLDAMVQCETINSLGSTMEN